MISIIVPIYNVRPFLMKCVDSIIANEYVSKEIILVDDGSTDGSGEMCDELEHRYSDVSTIHHEKNKGLVNARITGLTHARGEYILFVDPDDYVHPRILQTMADVILTYQADLVCPGFYWVEGDSETKDKRTITGVLDKEDIKKAISHNLLYDETINKAGMTLYLSGKLFERSLLEGSIQKSLGLFYGEDSIALLDILIKKTKKLVCIEEPLYYYVQHPSQITAKTVIDQWPSYLEVWNRMDKMGIEEWSSQLTNRIFSYIKPSIYKKYEQSGGVFRNNKYVESFRALRNAEVVKKYIWNNKDLPKRIKKSPHYILLKHRLYWLDYLMYSFIWKIRKVKKNSH